MAIDLTTEQIVNPVTFQGITKISFDIPHEPDSNGMSIFREGIRVSFLVVSWTDTGQIISSSSHSAYFADWPANFKTDVRAVYDRIEQYAISQGFIGAGTPEVL